MKEYLEKSIKAIEGIDDVVVVEEDIYQGEIYIETADELETTIDEIVDKKGQEAVTGKRNLSIVVGEEWNPQKDDVTNLQQVILRAKDTFGEEKNYIYIRQRRA